VKRCLLFLFILPALVAPSLFAVPEPSANDLMANRARLDELRKHPDQMVRLRRAAKDLLALSPARREQALQLDYDLHRQTAGNRARLLKTLERYTRWLDGLSDADRQLIDDVSNQTRRLAVIRELRGKEWLQSQPRKLRDQLGSLTGSAQADCLRKARLEDRQRRAQWASGRRFWKEMEHKLRPVCFADLDKRDQEGVKEFLMPMLSAEEKKQLLAQAEGNWPAYPMTLVELADRHPLALPGKHGPRTFDQLPEALKSRFNTKIESPFANAQTHVTLLRPNEGSWPKFAIAVTTLNKGYIRTPLPRELWACDFKSLLSPMQEYVHKMRKDVITTIEAQELSNAEGHWPEYPEKIQALAKSHALPPPPWETALYGPRVRWEDYRTVKAAAPLSAPAAKRQD
jgi:hypothetical protein